MFILLCALSLIFTPSIAMVPFEAYRYSCQGLDRCYTLFNDQDFISNGFKFDLIERYPAIDPYFNSSSNIGFAQSHAQAFTFKLWMSLPQPLTQWPIINELSVVKAALSIGYKGCEAPSGDDALPFRFSYAEDAVEVYLDPAFKDTEESLWCDIEYLNSQDLSTVKHMTFPGYIGKRIYAHYTDKEIRSLLKNHGIGIVSLKRDYALAYGFPKIRFDNAYLPHEPIFSYPANVVGVKQDEQGETWLLVYVFGAHDQSVNYIWVSMDLVDKDIIYFVLPVAAPEIERRLGIKR